ncbi:MAG: hypothetical protein DMF79_17415, partial [Acidobacteria bacterium]
FAWEPRVGIELSLPFSSMSIQLRAGLSGRSTTGAEGGSPAAAAPVPTVPPLPSPSPAPGPPATALQQITAVLPETPRGKETGSLRGSVGGSLVTAKGVRLDLAVRFGAEGTSVLAGTAIRF